EKILIQMLAFIIIFECLNEILFNIFRAFQQNQEYSFFISFQNFGEIALVIIMISLGYGLIGAVFALLAVRLISFLIMAIKIIKKIGIKIPEFLRIKEYLHFSLPSLPANISSWTVQSSDKYLIGIFLGANFVGYYAPAYAIGNSITFFIAPLIFILPAVLSKLYDENKIEEAKNYLKYSLKYFLMIAVPSVFGLAALSKQILTIFSTTEIAQKSYYIVPMVAFAILLLGIYSIVAQTIVLKKKTRTIGIIWVIAAFLNIGLNIILVPIFGIVAAAITTIAGYAFALMAAVYYSLSNFRFEIDWKFIIKSVFASILMYIFVLSLNPADLSKTIMTVVGGAIFYGIIMFFLKGIDEKEIKFLKGFFKRA
ncbi:MAG: polysaccharide biosynthesis C-terminal domain-containing protein, partial [Candidatus Paceibacterota bacterium]